MTISISNLLKQASEQLVDSDSPRLDAEVLLQHVLGCDRAYLYAHTEQAINDAQYNQFDALIKQRIQGIPIAYLTGSKEFWSMNLHVTNDTLIPRPETELLVDTALALLTNNAPTILDLGTGTGAIALALAHELPQANIIATDISDAALVVANNNAERLQITNIEFVISDWFKSLASQTFDIIISNPPYIKASDPHLNEGDPRFEPTQALVSGTDGLTDLTTIIHNSQSYLDHGGYLLLEHGYDQGEQLIQLMEQTGFTQIKTVFDLAGHHRVTHAVKN